VFFAFRLWESTMALPPFCKDEQLSCVL
jgi:hypothetical protein